MNISQNIRSEMALMGLRHEDMAKYCKVSKNTWFRWMREPENMTLYDLSRIAIRLKVKPSELLEEKK